MAGLKVFRTPIGFHDAYVAAPSQKAALEAWGADSNLFARGMAERVTDAKLTAEPLDNPGQVIRRARGSTAQHIAALPKQPRAAAKAPKRTAKTGTKSKPTARPKPRPSRSNLDEAEKALASVEARHRNEREKLARKEARLVRERRTLEQAQATEIRMAEQEIERAGHSYRHEMERWRG